tara:strand:+ start:2192 stop:2368 length:177 start_codon:yes stop_codon:yes gene_type:complete
MTFWFVIYIFTTPLHHYAIRIASWGMGWYIDDENTPGIQCFCLIGIFRAKRDEDEALQ